VVSEIYLDYDGKSMDTMMSEISVIKFYIPDAHFRVYKTSPDEENYHLVVTSVNKMDFDEIMFMIADKLSVDPDYIALVYMKQNFFRRVSSRIESGGIITPAPVLVYEG